MMSTTGKIRRRQRPGDGQGHSRHSAGHSVSGEAGRRIFRAQGQWLISAIGEIDEGVQAFLDSYLREGGAAAGGLSIDLSSVEAMDTAGAYLVLRLEREWQDAGGRVSICNASEHAQRLIGAIREKQAQAGGDPDPRPNPIIRMLENLGRIVYVLRRDSEMGFHIIGAAIRGPQMKTGRRGGVRPVSIIHHIDRMGIRAIPIVMLMSFLIGGIIAQQGAYQLRTFGVEVWAVDLVGVLLLREVGVLLTAIMIAGRSGSAMTAEIGSMKMREEIDALTVIGLNPIGVLVFPRLAALTIVMPLLAFLANMAALAGAALVLRFYSDISLDDFILRLRSGIDLSTVFSGLIKAPFMAMIIGIMAAVEGLKVEGSAESLGRRTTAAVVKAIFFVIVVDGMFAVFYAAIGY